MCLRRAGGELLAVSFPDARSMAPPCRIWRSNLLRAVVVLALGAGIGSWCVRASAAPVSLPDVATTAEDTEVEGEVLANDSQEFPCPGGPCEVVFDIGKRDTQPPNGRRRHRPIGEAASDRTSVQVDDDSSTFPGLTPLPIQRSTSRARRARRRR